MSIVKLHHSSKFPKAKIYSAARAEMDGSEDSDFYGRSIYIPAKSANTIPGSDEFQEMFRQWPV